MKLRYLCIVLGMYAFTPIHASAAVSTIQQTTRRVVLHKPSNAVRGVKQTVAIRYTLASRADSVALEILDARGVVIRTLRRAGNVSAGTHRAMWDMRAEPAATFPVLGARDAAKGPRVLPGNYRVRLRVDKQTPQTQGFAINTDSRVRGVTRDDMQAQYDLATQARTRLSELNETVATIRDIRSQVDDRVRKARDSKFDHGARLLKDKLTQVEEELYHVASESSVNNPSALPPKLNARIAAVIAAVDTIEGRPSAQTNEMFTELSARLDQQINWLEQIVRNDVKQFNDQFIAWKKLEPIERRKPK